MPGVNTSGRPSTGDIWLGRGKILLGRLDTTTKKPLEFRHVGNVPAFSINVETETLEHQNSRSGIKVIDREIILSQKFNVSLTLEELNFENLAIFFSGAATAGVTNPATANVTDQPITTDSKEGRWYELRNASGERLFDITPGSLVVEHGANLGAAVVLPPVPANYEIDAKWGMIFIPVGSAISTGQGLWFTYTGTGGSDPYDTVTIGTTSQTSVFLRYVGINPANSDKEMILDLHSVTLKPDGEFSLIGEEFAQLPLTGVAEKNETGYPTAPIGRLYYHASA